MPLLDDVSISPPTPADAEDILALVVDSNTAVIGSGDCTLEDVEDELAAIDDLRKDAWLARDRTATLTGYGWTARPGSGRHAEIEVVSARTDVFGVLLEAAVERGVAMVRACGHDQVILDKGVYRQDVEAATVLRDRGFAPATAFFRMRIDHHGEPPRAGLPPGIELRRVGDDEQLRRAALSVQNAAFVDHFAHEERTYEQWVETLDSRSTTDWDQLWVAERDGRAVAELRTSDQFIPDEDCGYVASLGVVAEERGRGIAKALLRHAFWCDAAVGRRGTILHVDSNNLTPALGVYEAVGMRTVLVIDVWRRVISFNAAPTAG